MPPEAIRAVEMLRTWMAWVADMMIRQIGLLLGKVNIHWCYTGGTAAFALFGLRY